MTVVKRVLKKKKNRCQKKLGIKNESMKITMCEKEYYFKLKNNNVCV